MLLPTSSHSNKRVFTQGFSSTFRAKFRESHFEVVRVLEISSPFRAELETCLGGLFREIARSLSPILRGRLPAVQYQLEMTRNDIIAWSQLV